MRVLITGGAGYIGSHTARVLAQRGHQAVIYDDLSTGRAELARGFELIVGSIADRGKVRQALAGADAVMHFAAYIEVGESVLNPRKYFQNNSVGSLALLDSVVESKVPCFIFSSSCAVYGPPARVPITEDLPRLPANPYGASKLLVEHALEAFGRAYGLRFASLRYFNAAGADDSGEIGEMHQPETHSIPSALEVAAGVRPELQIFGDDYPTPDGTCVRDYIHVTDLAEAHARALEYLAAGGPSLALNLGSEQGYSNREVVAMVEEVTGVTLRKHMAGRRPGDPPVLIADSRRARELLGWRPSRDLRQMVSSAWRWTQKYHGAGRAAGGRG